MIKTYDVECKECGNIEEQWVENNEEFEPCSLCGGEVKRTYSSFHFKLLYDNKKDTVGWSFNNYETSKYYDEVNAERKKGKDVEPLR